jgi:transposase
MYFQHDGALSHYTRLMMQHLNDTFPNRCIGRGSTINLPPRSPDLNPLDFCLWSWMKIKVYRRKVDTRDEVLDHVMEVIARIKERQDALRRATHHVLTRVAMCIDVDGEIFGNVLY